MGKTNKKVQVLKMMSKGDIETLGGNRWCNKARWLLTILFLVSFAWVVYWTWKTEPSTINTYIALSPSFACFTWWFIVFSVKGRKFWNEVKDKKEPIDLG